PSSTVLSSFRQDDRRARVSRICPISSLTSASDARSSRTDREPFCLALPFSAERAFPSGVRGPVPRYQGRSRSAASRSLWRPCSVRGPRFFRFRRPAATLRGLGSFGASVVLTADPFATFTYQFAVRFRGGVPGQSPLHTPPCQWAIPTPRRGCHSRELHPSD